jgi:chromosome segregation ATPase
MEMGRAAVRRVSKGSNMKNLIALNCAFAAIVICALPASSVARTDVPAKLEQLKENVSASQANLDQYEQSLRIVILNLNETEKALKTIEMQKVAIQKQTGQSAKDKASVDAARAEVDGHLRVERDRLAVEERQIEELKMALAKLEENRQRRIANIAAYEERVKAVDGERAGWSERSQSVNELDVALRAQEDQARAEKKRLIAKKAEYEEEIAKWKKQVRISSRSVANFGRLKPQ